MADLTSLPSSKHAPGVRIVLVTNLGVIRDEDIYATCSQSSRSLIGVLTRIRIRTPRESHLVPKKQLGWSL